MLGELQDAVRVDCCGSVATDHAGLCSFVDEQVVPFGVVADGADDRQRREKAFEPLQYLNLLRDQSPIFACDRRAIFAHGRNLRAAPPDLRHEVRQLRHEEDDHQSDAEDGQKDAVVLAEQTIHAVDSRSCTGWRRLCPTDRVEADQRHARRPAGRIELSGRTRR